MKYYLGIDPGKEGAFTVLDQNGNIVELIGMPLINREYNRQELISILTKYPYERVGLEDPSVIFGVGKSAVASLKHCVGLLEGLLLGLRIPHILVAPKEWQKECWKHVKTQKKVGGKGNDPKATSLLASLNLWPNTDFKVSNKGNAISKYNDGMIDASLIAEYVRRAF